MFVSVSAAVDSSTAVGDINYSVDGELSCWQARPYIGTFEYEIQALGSETSDFLKNIRLYVQETQAGTAWAFVWDERSISDSGTGAHTVKLEIDDYDLYVTNEAIWRLRLGESRLYLDGALHDTYAATTIDSTELIQPRTTPALSIAPELFAVADASNSIDVSDAAAAGWSYSSGVLVEGTVTGGWRYVEGGDVVELPVRFKTPPIPYLAGTNAPVAEITATNTWDATFTVVASEINEANWCNDSFHHVIERPYVTTTDTAGRAWLWPVLDSGVTRMNPVFEQAIRRFGLPRADEVGTREHYVSDDFMPSVPGTTTSASYTSTVLSSFATDTQVVGDTPGDLEDPFSVTLYSPLTVSGSRGEVGVVSAGYPWAGTMPAACSSPDWRTGRIAKESDAFYQFPSFVQTRSHSSALPANADMLATFKHQQAIPRLFNYWWNLNRHFAPVFPPNTLGSPPTTQDVWEVFGSDVESEYWRKSRQQWISEMAISNTETKRRNVICSEPLMDSLLDRGHGSSPTTPQLWQDIYSLPTSPWGISRFTAQIPDVPVAFTCTSASASLVHTISNCSVAAGANIVATPSGAGDIEFGMEYAKFQTAPWLFAAMSNRFRFNWSTTNVTSVTVYAEGWDGERVVICSSGDRNSWLDWPLDGTQTKFAGSWEQDFGRGYISDTGADVDAAGISPATMGDIVRSHVFGLLPGRTARRIVWKVTPVSVAAVTVNWPSFDQNTVQYVPELAPQGVFIAAEGPGVRFGSAKYWDGSFQDPPVASDAGTMPTILDGLCYKRVLFEGRSATDALDAEIATIYDSHEYSARSDMAEDAADGGQSNHSFWVNGATSPVLCLVSSLREAGMPMQCFPVRDRDADFQTTDDWCWKVWALAYRDRYYTTWEAPLRLNDGTSDWAGVDGTLSASYWKIYSHSHAVDNTEGLFDVLNPASTVLADLRPWHGSFALLASVASGLPLSCDAHPDGRLFRAYLVDGKAVVEYRGFDMVWRTFFTEIAADWVSIRIQKFGKSPKLYLVTQDGTSIKEYESTTSGATWSVATTLHSTGTPRYPTQDIELDGVRYTYWVNNSAPNIVQYIIRDVDGNTLAGVGTALSGIDDAAIAVRKQTPPGGVPTIYLQVIISGAVVEYSSTDGINFV